MQVYKKIESVQRILLIDNYDSFTFNLFHLINGGEVKVDVVKNDAINFDEIFNYDKIILSPGPGLPSEANDMMKVILEVDSKIPILGVCLGMQGVAEHLSGSIYNQDCVRHGVSESIMSIRGVLFKGIEEGSVVGLYHSWAVNRKGDFNVVATSNNGVVMAIENIDRKLYGVQFHPESIMSIDGKRILENFLAIK